MPFVVYCLFILFFTCSIVQGTPRSGEAKALFLQAMHSNVETRLAIKDGEIKTLRWTNTDGTRFLRSEIWKKGEISYIEIKNEDGFFYVDPTAKVAIKSPPPPEEDFSDVAEYDMRMHQFDGKEVYEIKKIIPLSEKTFKIWEYSRSKMPGYDNRTARSIFFSSPCVFIYFIDKQTKLILSIKGYNRNGRLMTQITYRETKKLLAFKHKDFAIPNGYRIERPVTSQELDDVMVQTYKQRKAKIRAVTREKKKREADERAREIEIEIVKNKVENFVFKHGVKLCVAIAMLTTGAIVLLKIKSRRDTNV